MTDQPYTDEDLRDAAGCLYSALAHLPTRAEIVKSLTGMYVPSRRSGNEGPTWGEVLNANELAVASGRIDDLMTFAAPTGEWAVDLGAAGLIPQQSMGWYCTTSGWDVAIQVATHPSLTDKARDELLAAIREAAGGAIKRVLMVTDVATDRAER